MIRLSTKQPKEDDKLVWLYRMGMVETLKLLGHEEDLMRIEKVVLLRLKWGIGGIYYT